MVHSNVPTRMLRRVFSKTLQNHFRIILKSPSKCLSLVLLSLSDHSPTVMAFWAVMSLASPSLLRQHGRLSGVCPQVDGEPGFITVCFQTIFSSIKLEHWVSEKIFSKHP